MARQTEAGEQSRSERQQRPQESKQQVTNRTGTAVGDGSRERERPIQTTRDRGKAVSRFAPDSGTTVGYGPSGRSQALMRHMADDIDQLLQLFGFGGLGEGLSQSLSTQLKTVWSPQIEVRRNDGQLMVRADLPGVDPNDVTVEIDDGVLAISGERKEEHEEKDDGFYRTERVYGQFYRAIPLPPNVDENHIEASFDNGVLEIKVPAPNEEPRETKRVEVKART